MSKRDDLNTPTDLDDKGTIAHAVICEVLRKHGMTYTGGCTPFRSPSEWRERGEEYGLKSHLVIVYDGGDVRQAIYPDGPNQRAHDEIVDSLAKHRLYFEWCTGWYAAVYDM